METTARQVGAALGLGAEHQAWLEGLARLGPPPGPVPLPRGDAADRLLARLGVPPRDRHEILEVTPSPGGDPALWWLLERTYHLVLRDVGDLDARPSSWPHLPPSLGRRGRCLPVFAFLAAVGDVRAWHRTRGVPDDVSWATLADLGRQVTLHREIHGTAGLHTHWWMTLHFRGGIYDLGRLQFALARLHRGPGGPAFWYDEPPGLGSGFGEGDPAIDLHVPSTGPLAPAACDASLARARRFFPLRFPEHRARLAICTSWLLDPQLADYLPERSNILAFQRRFRLVPGSRDVDDAMITFVFRRDRSALDDLPQRTSLERAVVSHLRAGGHWHLRTGWMRW